MPVQIQLRHDTAANWTAANPTLALGEAGVETDTSKVKFGNGATAWNSLAYFGADLSSHTGDTTDAHDASAISVDPSGLTNSAATDVQTALEDIDAAVSTAGGGVDVSEEGSPLTTTATTLDFVGDGVTASGSGATKTITIPGGGGGAALNLDNRTLDATYGDDFSAATLDAKWTVYGTSSGEIEMHPSGMASGIRALFNINGALAGMRQDITPDEEIDLVAKVSWRISGVGALHLYIVDSSGNGYSFGIRPSSDSGNGPNFKTLTAYALTGNTSENYNMLTFGAMTQTIWLRLTKYLTDYGWRFSMNGEAWTDWVPAVTGASITPAKVGYGSILATGVTDNSVLQSILYWIDCAVRAYGNNLCITPSSGTATASASSSGNPAANAVDGNGGTQWYATATGVQWWTMTWSVAQTINRIRLVSRADAWGSGYIEFSDGSTIPIPYMTSSMIRWFDFPSRSVTSFTVRTLRGSSGLPGFWEIEAYLAS